MNERRGLSPHLYSILLYSNKFDASYVITNIDFTLMKMDKGHRKFSEHAKVYVQEVF